MNLAKFSWISELLPPPRNHFDSRHGYLFARHRLVQVYFVIISPQCTFLIVHLHKRTKLTVTYYDYRCTLQMFLHILEKSGCFDSCYIPYLKIGIDGVVKQLKNLNQNKATGPDELPAKVLKETAAEIAPIITPIFQQSYNTSKLPDDWLQALVTPIHKKNLKSDPANYRPISLTCILCKVMEHIILSNMWKHLHKHNIILHFQHGFQSGLSCHLWVPTHRDSPWLDNSYR